MTRMRAYIAGPATDHPVLGTGPMPRPGEEDILVRVRAVALNKR